MTQYKEVNFDGLVGPTHHYGGLSLDNLASDSNRAAVSSPKKAALQGLAKMKAMSDMGYPQAVLPPLQRPILPALRDFGYAQELPEQALRAAFETDPRLLSAVSSASNMWTANAATVAPSCDTIDGQLHLVTANLVSKLHRSLEAPDTARSLQAIFGKQLAHDALPGGQAMGDEGAANHTRLTTGYGERGVHVFVYGREEDPENTQQPRFPGRQTLAASKAVARRLCLDPSQTVFIRQNQSVIDSGVFHNDVIAVGNLDCYFSHELAYRNGERALEEISAVFLETTGSRLHHVVVPDEKVSVERAVKTYLFNSQLVGNPGDMTLIAPTECEEDPEVSAYLASLCEMPGVPINQVKYFNLRESMRNGGGPACLRLRVVLSELEIKNLGARVMFDDPLYGELCQWVEQYYREELTLQDIATKSFYEDSREALAKLARILELDEVYSLV
jgi:succinylarginine dihydrolase